MSPNLATYLQADGSIDQILLLCLWYYWQIKIHVITIFKALYIASDGFATPIIPASFFLSSFWGSNIIMHPEVHLGTNVPHTSMQFWLLNLYYQFKTSVILMEQLVGWWWKQCQASSKADLPASRHLESFHWPPHLWTQLGKDMLFSLRKTSPFKASEIAVQCRVKSQMPLLVIRPE